jgi:hypothetical protein
MAEILRPLVATVRYILSEKENVYSCPTEGKSEEKSDLSSAPDTPKLGASNEVVAQVSMLSSIQYCLGRLVLDQQFHSVEYRT